MTHKITLTSISIGPTSAIVADGHSPVAVEYPNNQLMKLTFATYSEAAAAQLEYGSCIEVDGYYVSTPNDSSDDSSDEEYAVETSSLFQELSSPL